MMRAASGKSGNTGNSGNSCNLDRIIKASPAVTYVMSTGAGFNYISDNIFDLLGYDSNEIISNPDFWFNCIHPEDQPKIQEAINVKRNFCGWNYEYRVTDKNGNFVWIHDVCRVVRKDKKPVEIVGVWLKVTEKYASEEEENYKESHDLLTGLINRRSFERRLDQLLKKSAIDGSEHILCYMDLDQFKVINDTYGHVAGDQLLQCLGLYLQKNLSKRDTFGYLGGDEFGILLEECTLEKAERVFEIIQQALQDFEFDWQDKIFSVSASIGVIPLNRDYNNTSEVMSMADIACYSAKETGRNQIHIYKSNSGSVANRHKEMRWVERINQAIQEDRFYLYFQPINGLNGNSANKYFELLLRLKDEQGNIVTPGNFLPAAERYYLSEKIDRWVIATALTWLETYSASILPNQRIGINLSGQSLASSSLLDFFVHELILKEVSAQSLYIEITESAAIANLKQAIKLIETLKNFGCQFALDDFGKGVSSFNYLKILPVDYLKIDGAFVKDMNQSGTDYVMVKAINEVGKTMGKKTIAECVENINILPYLEELKVDYAQGYAIAKPRPLTEFFIQ